MRVLLTATVQSHIAQFHLPLIDMLKANGYEVHVAARDNLTEKNGLKLETPNKVFDIPFERSPLSKRNLVAFKQLKTIVSENKYDVIHCNTPMGGVITRLAAKETRKKGTKVFYTAHGFHFYKGGPWKNWLIYYPIEKWLARYTDKLITITKEDFLLALNKFKTSVYHVHGVGANGKRYFPYSDSEKERLRKELGFLNNEFLILCIGELNKNKNQTTVIKAFAESIKVVSNGRLLLAGNGPLDQELKTLVDSLNLNNSVKFLGYRTDLDKYMNICDVVISASYREGLPLNIMEALLCKKPVIASINRGHKELIKEGRTGYLVEPNDIHGFSKYIIQQYQNEGLREELGSAGNRVIQLFRTEKVLDELRDVYEVKLTNELSENKHSNSSL